MDAILESRGKQWLLLSVVALALFVDGLDGTIVNVVIPEIGGSFGVDTGTASWVITVYYLMMAGLILIFGKIADSGAIRRLFVIGMLLFAFSSLACALSQSLSVLLVFRAAQGVGAALLATTAFMLCVKYLPKKMATFAFSVGILGTSLGAAIGPAAGGFLEHVASWHMVFLINVPIGVIGAVLAMHAIPKDPGFTGSGFDIRGSVVLFIAMIAGLYALESIPSDGLQAASGICAIVSLVAFLIFSRIERKAVDPVLKLSLFRLPRLDAATLVLVIQSLVYMGCLYLLPFLLKVVFGMDSLESGVYLLLPSFGILAFCLWVGKAADRIGNRPFAIISNVVMLIAAVMFCFVGEDTIALLMASMFIFGATWGLGGGPMGGRMVENVPDEDRPKASSLMSFFMYFGSALGTALYAGLFGFGSGSSGTAIDELSSGVFLDGFVFCMYVGIALTAIAIFLAVVVNEKKSQANADG